MPNRFFNLAIVMTGSLSMTPGALAGASCAETGSPAYEYVSLDGIEPTFGARVINDAGEVAGSVGTNTLFVWTDEEIRTHEFDSGPVTAAGISEGGVVLGYRTVGFEEYETFLWFSRTGEVEVVVPPVSSFPNDVNDDLVICGTDQDNLFGFALDTTTDDFHSIAFGRIPKIGVGTVGATAINESGTVVGAEVVFQEDFEFYISLPYWWTEQDGIVPLPVFNPPAGFGGYAVDVNENGDVAGSVLDEFAASRPALWTNGGTTLTAIPVPFGYFVADATGLNDQNEVTIVAPNDLFGFTRAFVWEDGFYTDLSCYAPPGQFAIRPLDINNNGEILTQLSGTTDGGTIEVVVLRPKGLDILGDLDDDGDVDFTDLLLLLEAWGPCVAGPACPADLDESGDVGFTDLLILLSEWNS